MNCVGIDVSKGKSMIAVMRPFGEVVVSPFEVRHTANELSELAGLLKSLDGETRVVMESTGNYHAPMAVRSGWTLSPLFGIASVSVVCLRKPLPPSTRSGAESTATISAKIRRWIFMPLPVDASVSCRKQIRQNFW